MPCLDSKSGFDAEENKFIRCLDIIFKNEDYYLSDLMADCMNDSFKDYHFEVIIVKGRGICLQTKWRTWWVIDEVYSISDINVISVDGLGFVFYLKKR